MGKNNIYIIPGFQINSLEQEAPHEIQATHQEIFTMHMLLNDYCQEYIKRKSTNNPAEKKWAHDLTQHFEKREDITI